MSDGAEEGDDDCEYAFLKRVSCAQEIRGGNRNHVTPVIFVASVRIISNLSRTGMIRGCLALLAVATDADKPQPE